MRVYKDLLTGDELFSDVYPISDLGVLIEVKGKLVTETDDIDEKVYGGNASAETQQECVSPSSTSGVNIVLRHRLVETTFNKKSYKIYIKEYVKKILEKLKESNSDRAEVFKKEAMEEIPKLIAKVEDCQCYVGESMNTEGMVALLEYRCDGDGDEQPYMIFIKDGLIEEKV